MRRLQVEVNSEGLARRDLLNLVGVLGILQVDVAEGDQLAGGFGGGLELDDFIRLVVVTELVAGAVDHVGNGAEALGRAEVDETHGQDASRRVDPQPQVHMRHAFQHPRVAGRRLGQPQPRVAVEAGGFDDFGFEQVAGLVPRLEGARGVVGEAGALAGEVAEQIILAGLVGVGAMAEVGVGVPSFRLDVILHGDVGQLRRRVVIDA